MDLLSTGCSTVGGELDSLGTGTPPVGGEPELSGICRSTVGGKTDLPGTGRCTVGGTLDSVRDVSVTSTAAVIITVDESSVDSRSFVEGSTDVATDLWQKR